MFPLYLEDVRGLLWSPAERYGGLSPSRRGRHTPQDVGFVGTNLVALPTEPQPRSECWFCDPILFFFPQVARNPPLLCNRGQAVQPVTQRGQRAEIHIFKIVLGLECGVIFENLSCNIHVGFSFRKRGFGGVGEIGFGLQIRSKCIGFSDRSLADSDQ